MSNSTAPLPYANGLARNEVRGDEGVVTLQSDVTSSAVRKLHLLGTDTVNGAPHSSERSLAAIGNLVDRISVEALTENVNLRDRISALNALTEASLAVSHMQKNAANDKSVNEAKLALATTTAVTLPVPMPQAAVAAPATAPMSELERAWPLTTVVIPTLNEADNLRQLLPRLPTWLHEIIIVDGRSKDGTVDVVREICPQAKIVLETRAGKGVALNRGFEEATGEIVIILDADGSMDPNEMYSFVGALMSGADLVKGSRFSSGAGTDDMSLIRMLGNWGLTKMVSMLFGGKFTDLCYGYMGFWRRCLPHLASDSPGFEIETVLCIRALQARLRIVEVASFEHPRIFGDSNLRAFPDGLRVLRSILTAWFKGPEQVTRV